MAYVDIEDIRVYLPDAEGVDDDALQQFVDEEELHVSNRLGILPEDNDIVYSIIRDLVIARAMLTLLPMQSRDTALATTIRGEALRRLKQAEDDGVTPRVGPRVSRNTVYTPIDDGLPFFTPSDFNLGSNANPPGYDPSF